MRPTPRLVRVLLFALALLTAGCTSSERRAARDAGAAARILGTLAVIGVIAGRSIDRPSRSPDGISNDGTGAIDAWTPSARDLEDAPTFDPARAQAALANIDFLDCRAVAPRGYGGARVTVHPSGDISHVRVDPSIVAAGAKCIADELARARAPLFRGDPVSVEMTWYVP